MTDTEGETPTHEGTVVFELYHENSKQRRSDLEFNRRINLVNNNPDFHRVVARAFKAYPGAAVTSLPGVQPAAGRAFELVAALRRSVRRFSAVPLTLEQLARLLWFGNGLTGRLDPSSHDIVQPVRAAPSGGALYPVELYAVVMAVEGLEPGVYHYAVDRHAAELLRPGSFAPVLSEATNDPETFSQAAVALVLTGVFGRSHFKYGERAYRFTLLEAGHVAQNILLEATALELGAVAVGGFVDDELNRLLDVDGVDEAVLYLVAAGHPAPRPRPGQGPRDDVVEMLLGALWDQEGADGQDGRP